MNFTSGNTKQQPSIMKLEKTQRSESTKNDKLHTSIVFINAMY